MAYEVYIMFDVPVLLFWSRVWPMKYISCLMCLFYCFGVGCGL